MKSIYVSSIFCLITGIFTLSSQEVQPIKPVRVEIFKKYEVKIQNPKVYSDPFRAVELNIQLIHKDGKICNHVGFYDGDEGWKFRFTPDETGRWDFVASFSDGSAKHEGAMWCVESEDPGMVQKNRYNPFWLGKVDEPKTLFRSFHVGDRFFAENWDDPLDDNDGNKRDKFLDWLQENKYNMLSIASLFTNRQEEGRGKGWDTPSLWPPDVQEFRKLEVILDELEERNITVFPFAGFFGARGEWPTDKEEQELYLKYMLARIGHYQNIIFNVAGPEPFWRELPVQYKNAMRMLDIERLGSFIETTDVHNHIITVHNEKRATKFGDPFISLPWYGMSTLQGPTTTDREKLFSGLIMNHPRNKVCYAQETLWYGNKNHPDYTDDDIRKNAYTILFSGSILGFADMNGNSSTGFSGTMNFDDLHQDKHEIVKKAWDWFETIPFHQMTTRQDVMRGNSFCLANEGVEYYVYFESTGKDQIHLDYPYFFETEWINAKDPTDIRKGEKINKRTDIETPKDGDDWIFHAYAPKPKVVATGHFPDLTVDSEGNIHLVYSRSGLKYKKYYRNEKYWSEEQDVGCNCENIKRSDPDIVVDSKGNPYVYCGKEFAWFDGTTWHKNIPGSIRDTELAIDSKDNIYLVKRAGHNGGNIGLLKKHYGKSEWIEMKDPDINSLGPSDHVYSDIIIDNEDKIHLVQRHGPQVEVTYRSSSDGGQTWIKEDVMDERAEAPHITVTSEGVPFISTGKGYVSERTALGNWKQHGRKLHVYSRMHPELGIDKEDNIYLTSFGGFYNTFFKEVWIGEKAMEQVTQNERIGFTETAGWEEFAYIVWEEGKGDADGGLSEDSKIVVGILYPDGRIIGIDNEDFSD